MAIVGDISAIIDVACAISTLRGETEDCKFASMAPKEQIERELKRITEMAAKSKDPGLLSKVIALNDKNVRLLLSKKLAAGGKLVRVSLLPDPVDNSRRVFFELRPPGEDLPLVQEGFMVAVDLPNSKIMCLNDPYVLTENDVYGLPFVLARESKADEVFIPLEETHNQRRQAVEFFKSLKLSYDPCSVVQSTTCVVDCVVGSISYSGTPTEADDSKSDYVRERVTDD
jgi:hypothetical protein